MIRLAKECAAAKDAAVARRGECLRASAAARARLGDQAAAAADLKQALLLAPADGEALLSLAELTRGNPREALGYATRAAEAGATPRRRAAAHRLAADVQVDSGDKAGAKESLRRALALDAGDLEALRGMAALEAGRDAASFAARASSAAARAPGWCRGSALRRSAGIWLDLKRPAEAAADLTRGLDSDPDDLEALKLLIRIRTTDPALPVALGPPPAGAVREEPVTEAEAEAALEPEPDDLEALRRLFTASRAAGKTARARAVVDRFLLAILRAPVWQQRDAYLQAAKMQEALGTDVPLVWRTLDLALRLDLYAPETGLQLSRFGHPDSREVAIGVSSLVMARKSFNDAAGAEATAVRALRACPACPEALFANLPYLLERKRLEEAGAAAERLLKYCDDLSRLIEKRSRDPMWVNAPETHEEMRRDDFRRAALQTLVQTRESSGRLKEALAYSDRLIEALAKSPAADRAAALQQKDRLLRRAETNAP